VEGGDAAPPPPSSPPPGYSWEELQEELPLHTRIRVLWEDKDGADEWHAGLVKAHSSTRGCCVVYDDGEVCYHRLLGEGDVEEWEIEAAEGAVAAAEEAELAAALQEIARLEQERRVAEEQPPQPEAPPREEEPPPADFICPITTEVMSDPVMATDGHSYERKQIERWLATKSTSPMTGEALEHSILTPNHALRGRIREWQEAHH